jgi:putative DNA primase/helicase
MSAVPTIKRAGAAVSRIDEAIRAATLTSAPLNTPWVSVPINDLADAKVPPPDFWWHGYVPAGLVTALGAHGGTGKSMLGLMLAVAAALGRDLFGVPTRRARTCFFSAEDPAQILRHRLKWICGEWSVDPAALEGWLHLLDATDGDPRLFHQAQGGTARMGNVTPTYHALLDYIEAKQIDLLVVDNSSDTFDGNENDRSSVRGFMRSLMRLAQPARGLLLLTHVDKGTARGDRAGAEGYSGSTAWHNSARSRLFLQRLKDGTLLLEHQKANHGPLQSPLRLCWPFDRLPRTEVQAASAGAIDTAGQETVALLRLIDEFTRRGESVSTAITSRSHAAKLLRGQRGFPTRLKDPEVFNLLREAERAGLLARLSFKGSDRKARERWELTSAGRTAAGTAATAATSRDLGSGALVQPQQEPAATAATSPPGGVGEKSAHPDTQEVSTGAKAMPDPNLQSVAPPPALG